MITDPLKVLNYVKLETIPVLEERFNKRGPLIVTYLEGRSNHGEGQCVGTSISAGPTWVNFTQEAWPGPLTPLMVDADNSHCGV